MTDPRLDKIEFARRIAEDVRLSADARGIASTASGGIGSLCTAIELLAEALLMGPTLTEALLADPEEGRRAC